MTFAKIALLLGIAQVASAQAGYVVAPATTYTALKAVIDGKLHFDTYAGNPNTHMAGIEGKDIVTDTTNHVMYRCTSTGDASSAVWTVFSGTVTSVGLAGTANQLTVTGSTPITSSGSWTLSLPSVLTLPGTINKLTLTAPATAATLTLGNNKTVTVSNTLTFTGTDSSSVNFGAGGTVAYTTNLVRPCALIINGSGTAGAIQTTDSINAQCLNSFGSTLTLLGVSCYANTGTTTVVNPTVHGGSAVLSAPLTCGNGSYAAGSIVGGTTIASLGSIDGIISTAGTATQITIVFALSL